MEGTVEERILRLQEIKGLYLIALLVVTVLV